jgi:hypothetical protein
VYWNSAPTSMVGAASAGGEWYCEVASGTEKKSATALQIASGEPDFILICAVANENQPGREEKETTNVVGSGNEDVEEKQKDE